jgi:uncharacterized membrane protein (DUF485 family)
MVDWREVEQSEEFRQVAARRRRVVQPLLIVFVLWFGTFIVLTGYARGFMAEEIYRGFTVAYAAAFSLIVMTWLLAFLYLRASRSSVDPHVEDLDL